MVHAESPSERGLHPHPRTSITTYATRRLFDRVWTLGSMTDVPTTWLRPLEIGAVSDGTLHSVAALQRQHPPGSAAVRITSKHTSTTHTGTIGICHLSPRS